MLYLPTCTIIYHKHQPNVGKYDLIYHTSILWIWLWTLHIFWSLSGPITMTITHHVPWEVLRFFMCFFGRYLIDDAPKTRCQEKEKLKLEIPLSPAKAKCIKHHDLPGNFLTCLASVLKRMEQWEFSGAPTVGWFDIGDEITTHLFFRGL